MGSSEECANPKQPKLAREVIGKQKKSLKRKSGSSEDKKQRQNQLGEQKELEKSSDDSDDDIDWYNRYAERMNESEVCMYVCIVGDVNIIWVATYLNLIGTNINLEIASRPFC